MNNEKMVNTVKEKAGKVFTKKNFQRLAAVLVVCAVPLSGGAWYQYQQKAAMKAEVAQARAKMIEQKAERQGMALISEDKVKEITAKQLSTEQDSITFKKIALKDGAKHENKENGKDGHKDGRKDKRHKDGKKDDRHDGRQENTQQPEPQQQPAAAPMQPPVQDAPPQQPAPAPQASPGQMPPQSPALYDFIPLYKVDCKIGNVGYDLSIDAVTGNVIKCEIDD